MWQSVCRSEKLPLMIISTVSYVFTENKLLTLDKYVLLGKTCSWGVHVVQACCQSYGVKPCVDCNTECFRGKIEFGLENKMEFNKLH